MIQKRIPFYIALMMVFTLLLGGFALPAYGDDNPQDDGSYGYIFKLKDDASVNLRLMDANGGTIELLKEESLYLAPDLASIRNYTDESNVAYIVPNCPIQLLEFPDTAPDDPYYINQWNLNKINVAAAWQKGLYGQGVTVGVIDSGLNAGHEDLTGLQVTGKNFTVISGDLTQNTSNYTDDQGHGSFVTGIIAADINNGTGVSGMTDQVKVASLRVFENGRGTLAGVILALQAAVDDYDCDVINMSLGTSSLTSQQLTALQDAINHAAEQGVLLIAAVGNDGNSTLSYPAACDHVIGVGSVDSSLTVSSFSQRNSSVFVSAPGELLSSLWCGASNSYNLAKTDGSSSGTSYAAPCVAAMAVMAKNVWPEITTEDFKTLLKETVTDKGVAGYDTSYGYGVVDVETFEAALFRTNTITFYLNDGSFAEGTTIPTHFIVTSETIVLPTPEKAGYTFGGWYTTADFQEGTAVSQIPQGSSGNLEFYAKWTKTTYTITYQLNGEDVSNDGNPAGYQIDSATITLVDPVYEGHIFDGWYTTEDFQDGTKVTEIPTGSCGNLIFYAKWLKPYALTLDFTEYTFAQAAVGYDEQSVATFTLTGSGGETVSGIVVSLDGENAADYFEITQPQVTSLANGATTTFTVKPKTGLAIGTYQAAVTVTGDNGATATATVSFTVTKVFVTSIVVTGADNAAKITTKSGTLQLNATVLPSNATDQGVTWTVTSGAGYGSVGTTGLLTALANGSVTVRATAKDGSGIYGAMTVSVSGQTETITSGGGGGGGGVTQYTITAKAGTGGSISPTAATVDSGDDVTFTITADTDYKLGRLLVDGSEVELAASYTFENIKKNHTIEAVFIFLPAAAVWVNPFADVAAQNWYYEAVSFANRNHLFQGTADKTFSPNSTMTRGMFVTVLGRLYELNGKKITAGAGSPFSDVAADAWYADYVTWAAANGIVQGDASGAFRANDSVTREEMALFLYRYASYVGLSIADSNATSFDALRDSGDTSSWAVEAMKWAAATGILNGNADGALRPQGNGTRAQVAQMLLNFYNKVLQL